MVNDILRSLIESLVSEIAYEEFTDTKPVRGSTHQTQKSSLKGREFWVKFPDESELSAFDPSRVHDPSLQILVEYLGYRIYSLYPGVKIPGEIHLVFKKGKLGIATSDVSQPVFDTDAAQDAESSFRDISAGVMVDMFLANWDAPTNIIVSGDSAYRIDPGGAMTFRAQGGRKDSKFGVEPGETQTMLDPDYLQDPDYALTDLKQAAETFLSVSWGAVVSMINKTVAETTKELTEHKLNGLSDEWKREASDITKILHSRHGRMIEFARKCVSSKAA